MLLSIEWNSIRLDGPPHERTPYNDSVLVHKIMCVKTDDVTCDTAVAKTMAALFGIRFV